MGLKKRQKVSAEFNMSSLTDIIFLLLIFFMLTSSLVAPNSLNLKLPGSKTPSTSQSKEDLDDVRISRSGKYYLNGKQYRLGSLQEALRKRARSKSKYTMTISPDKGTPTEYVANIMDLALRYNINGVLAMEKD